VDLTYRLVVDMSARGTLGPSLDTLGRRGSDLDGLFGRLGQGASAIGGKLSSAFEGAVEKAADLAATVATLGAAAGFGAVTYGVAHLNNELEKTQISLAAIFGANGQTADMTQGMRRAADVMNDMRKDAAQLPGEFKDLVGIFQTAAIPAFRAGMNIDSVRTLSSKVMAVGAITSLPMAQTAREFAMLMEGRAGAHNVLGMRLAGLSGDAAHQFNAKLPAERVKVLTQALDKFAPAIAIYANSFDGLSSTMVDNAKRFLGVGTSGLFEKVKGAMAEANAWYDKNQDSAMGWARTLGFHLEHGWDVGRRKIEEWGPLIVHFAEAAEGRLARISVRIGPVIERLEGGAKGLLANPERTLDKLGTVGALYGASKVAGPLTSLAGEAGGLFAAAPEVGAAVAVGGAGIAAGVYAILDAVEHNEHAAANLGEAGEHLGVAVERIGHAFEVAGPLIDLYGTLLTNALELMAHGVEIAAKVIAEAADHAKAQWDLVFHPYGDAPEKAQQAADQKLNDEMMAEIRKRRDVEVDPRLGAMARAALEQAQKAPKTVTGAGGGGGGTHIQRVEIVVSSNQDPSRIARLTVERLQEISRFPTSSRNVRNFSATR